MTFNDSTLRLVCAAITEYNAHVARETATEECGLDEQSKYVWHDRFHVVLAQMNTKLCAHGEMRKELRSWLFSYENRTELLEEWPWMRVFVGEGISTNGSMNRPAKVQIPEWWRTWGVVVAAWVSDQGGIRAFPRPVTGYYARIGA